MARDWPLRLLAFALLALTTAACFGPGNMNVDDLTARERSVRVFHGVKPDCEYTELGPVEAISGTNFEKGTYASSLAKMQRLTVAMGGNALIVTDHSQHLNADRASGTAIRCQ